MNNTIFSWDVIMEGKMDAPRFMNLDEEEDICKFSDEFMENLAKIFFEE